MPAIEPMAAMVGMVLLELGLLVSMLCMMGYFIHKFFSEEDDAR